MGCPKRKCTGYELTANLDFDTNEQRRCRRGRYVLECRRRLGPHRGGGVRRVCHWVHRHVSMAMAMTLANLFINRNWSTQGRACSGASVPRGVAVNFRDVGLVNADMTHARARLGGQPGRASYGCRANLEALSCQRLGDRPCQSSVAWWVRAAAASGTATRPSVCPGQGI